MEVGAAGPGRVARLTAVDRRGPARVALVTDYELIRLGLRHLFTRHRDLELVEAPYRRDVRVDVALFDPALPDADGHRARQRSLLANRGAHVVLYTWDAHRRVAEEAMAAGVSGCLSKSLPGDVLCMALRRILRGTLVVQWGEEPPDLVELAALSRRELEVLRLIGQGLTNEDIAQLLFLSPNSVKSYIRSAYRKIRVERRSQAILWAHQHGVAAGQGAPEPEAQRSGLTA